MVGGGGGGGWYSPEWPPSPRAWMIPAKAGLASASRAMAGLTMMAVVEQSAIDHKLRADWRYGKETNESKQYNDSDRLPPVRGDDGTNGS